MLAAALLATTLVTSSASAASADSGIHGVPDVTMTEDGLVFDQNSVQILRDFSDGSSSRMAATTTSGEPLFLYAAHDTPCVVIEVQDFCYPEEELERIYVGYAAIPTAVRLVWTPAHIQEDVTYSIVRDGTPVASVLNATEYLDTGVDEGATHEYLIEVAIEDLRGPDPEFDESAELPDDSDEYDDVLWGLTVGMPVIIPAYAGSPEEAADAIEAMAIEMQANLTSTFVYRTFISPATAPGFPCTFSNRYFGGDGRSWSATSGTHRTRMMTVINWSVYTMNHSKSIGTTKLYNSNGTLNSTMIASGSNMIFEQSKFIGGGRVEFRYNHSASNPYCPTKGAIRYYVRVNIWKSGAYVMEGWRRKAPHHEVYLRQDSG
jgi:hypothetical protein